MSETTTQPDIPDLHAEVTRVAQRIKQIRDIAQISGSYRFVLPRLLEKPTLAVRDAQDGRSHAVLNGSVITVTRTFSLQGLDDTDDTVLLDIQGVFTVTYDLAEPESISDEVLQKLGEINSRFNLTAYWREFVQSCCARAGLPPFPINPFNGVRALKGLKAPAPPEP